MSERKALKAEKKRRIKERWFDAGTVAFERVFPGVRTRVFPDLENPYICPLCRRPFARTAISDGSLTFEDAPPKSYSGKPVALTCKSCNNSLGTFLDSSLSLLDSGPMSSCRISIDGVEVNAFQEFRPNGRHFSIPDDQNNPASAAQFHKIMNTKPAEDWATSPMKLEWNPIKRRRADLTWLKAAYMVAFATWGYMYALSPALRVVRQQLLHHDDEIIRQFKMLNRSSPRNTRFLMYVRQPRDLTAIAVGMGQHLVLLPADGRDMTVYSRLDSAVSNSTTLSLSGDTYFWPKAPSHSLDVVPFDSPLVLPTPGDVHLLS